MVQASIGEHTLIATTHPRTIIKVSVLPSQLHVLIYIAGRNSLKATVISARLYQELERDTSSSEASVHRGGRDGLVSGKVLVYRQLMLYTGTLYLQPLTLHMCSTC